MKRIVYIIGVCLLGFFAFTGCEGPAGLQGEPGKDGKDGADGTNGTNGQDGTALCAQCHNNSTEILARDMQWKSSGHAVGSAFARSAGLCAACHTGEGFKLWIGGADPNTLGIMNPTPQTCRTCHNVHKDFDKTKDFKPVDTSIVTGAVSLMTGNTLADAGRGNLCMHCHQPRKPSPYPVPGGDSIKPTSYRWGMHYGSEGSVYSGDGAFLFAGDTKPGNSVHTTAIKNGCVTCHMGKPYGSLAGGHSMHMFYDAEGTETLNQGGCTSCHADSKALVTKVKTTQDGIKAKLADLGNKLIALQMVDTTGYIVVPKRKWSADEAGAVHNYLLILRDGSHGVHNAAFANGVLDNTLKEVNSWTVK